jgi:hypothetical protein
MENLSSLDVGSSWILPHIMAFQPRIYEQWRFRLESLRIPGALSLNIDRFLFNQPQLHDLRVNGGALDLTGLQLTPLLPELAIFRWETIKRMLPWSFLSHLTHLSVFSQFSIPPTVLPCVVAFESTSMDLSTLPDIVPNIEL